MRQRSVSSIGVVLVGLVSAIAGGPVFAVVFTALATLAFIEVTAMAKVGITSFRYAGGGLIVCAGLLGYVGNDTRGLPLLVAGSIIVPLVLAVFTTGTSLVESWSTSVACSLYLSVPVFAAVSLRQMSGDSAEWVTKLDGLLMPGGSDTGRGLGWLLLALLITWLSDTGAYLVGKTIGRHKLLPRVSPNKTVEGAIGGLVCAAAAAAIGAWLFDLRVEIWFAAIIGIGLGGVGMLGDLAESMLKRQLGVKDSGSLIPGHGGVLDRIDALIFIVMATWLLAPVLN